MDIYNTLLWVEQYENCLDFKSLSSMPGFPLDVIRLNINKDWDWFELSTNRKLDLDIIQLAHERGCNLNWESISKKYKYEKNLKTILSINSNLPWVTKYFK